MIIYHDYPVCEYDTNKEPIIKPTDFLEKCLPEKCIITFFRRELNQFVSEHKLPIIGYLHSEVLDIPIYDYRCANGQFCITLPFSTAPGAAGTIEELHAMGCINQEDFQMIHICMSYNFQLTFCYHNRFTFYPISFIEYSI